MKRRTRTITNKSRAQVKQSGSTWKFSLLAVLAVAILGVGLFIAANNQFSAVTYGFKNSELRKEIETLEAEKRRLMLSREVAMSPAEISKAARKMGFSTMTARNIDTYTSSEPLVAKKTAKVSEKSPIAGKIIASLNATASAKGVSKTALVTPVIAKASQTRTRN